MRVKMRLIFVVSPLSLPSPTRGPLLTSVDFGSSPQTLIIMTHKSLLAPPVCHVSAHNNYIKYFYKLSWHGLFVTSGQHRGSADLAEPRCVVFPGWRGKSHTNSFCMGLSGSPGVARWEPVCSGRACTWCKEQKKALTCPEYVERMHQGFIC